MRSIRPFPPARRFVVVMALLATSQVRGADEPKKLPEGVTEITKEHLVAKVPNFFCFDYPFEPLPGKRLWLRVDDSHFLERYPNGTDSIYKVLGHAKARDMGGTIVFKVEGDPDATQTNNDGKFQVFIPDKGNETMAILFRHVGGGQKEWRDMAWSLNKPTIIQKVE